MPIKTLSPRQFGEAIGVSESSVKRWADEGRLSVERTAGGHRRITLAEFVRFVRESGLSVVKPQSLGVAELNDMTDASRLTGASQAAAEGVTPATGHRLREALLNGRAGEVRAIVLSSYLDGMSVAELCDGPVRSAMMHIGSLRRHGREGVFVERRAGDLIAQSLHQLRGLLPTPADDAPVAVGGAPEGDDHVLPSLMAAVTLASLGWREINLGHNAPLDVIADAADRCGGSLVWLAVSVDRPIERLVTEVATLAARLAKGRRTLVVGGRAWPDRVRLKAANVRSAGSMVELDRIARTIAERRAPRSNRPADEPSHPADTCT